MYAPVGYTFLSLKSLIQNALIGSQLICEIDNRCARPSKLFTIAVIWIEHCFQSKRENGLHGLAFFRKTVLQGETQTNLWESSMWPWTWDWTHSSHLSANIEAAHSLISSFLMPKWQMPSMISAENASLSAVIGKKCDRWCEMKRFHFLRQCFLLGLSDGIIMWQTGQVYFFTLAFK